MKNKFCAIACIIMTCTILHGCAKYDPDLWFVTFRDPLTAEERMNLNKAPVIVHKPYIPPIERFQSPINSWDKAPIGELIFYWGKPHEIIATENGVEVYRFMRHANIKKRYSVPKTVLKENIIGILEKQTVYTVEYKTRYRVTCRTDIIAKNGIINASESSFSTSNDGISQKKKELSKTIETIDTAFAIIDTTLAIIDIFSPHDNNSRNYDNDDDDFDYEEVENISNCTRIDPWPSRHAPTKSMEYYYKMP